MNLEKKIFLVSYFLSPSCFLIFLLVIFNAPILKELIKTSNVYNFAFLDIKVFAY